MTNKYKVGQILVNKESGDKWKVLEVLENTALVNFLNYLYWYTFANLDESFTIEKEDWRPKHGDNYWYVGDDSKIYERYKACGLEKDLFRLATKNCFSTKEEAEQRLSEIKKEYGIK